MKNPFKSCHIKGVEKNPQTFEKKNFDKTVFLARNIPKTLVHISFEL